MNEITLDKFNPYEKAVLGRGIKIERERIRHVLLELEKTIPAANLRMVINQIQGKADYIGGDDPRTAIEDMNFAWDVHYEFRDMLLTEKHVVAPDRHTVRDLMWKKDHYIAVIKIVQVGEA